MKARTLPITLALFAMTFSAPSQSAAPATSNAPWPNHPVSLVEALNLAESYNGAILKAKKDLEASAGVVIRTKAIAVPKLQIKGSYQADDPGSVDHIQFPPPSTFSISLPNQNWSVGIQL